MRIHDFYICKITTALIGRYSHNFLSKKHNTLGKGDEIFRGLGYYYYGFIQIKCSTKKPIA